MSFTTIGQSTGLPILHGGARHHRLQLLQEAPFSILTRIKICGEEDAAHKYIAYEKRG